MFTYKQKIETKEVKAMNTKTTHITQDSANISPAQKYFILSDIKNLFIGFTSFLLLGAVTFPMIITLIFLAQLTTAGHLESGLSYVLFG